MIKKYTIYGERCSGTNYLQQLIDLNFEVSLTWDYGWKHFFGFNDLSNSDDTLFICIIRNPYDWINSLYRKPYHLSIELKTNIESFLNNEIISLHDNSKNEIIEDKNIYNPNNRYKNIFELRHTKLKFLIEDLPKKIKNYILIKHEDLLDNFQKTIYKIKDKGLKIKNNIKFPLNIKYDSKNKKKLFIKNGQKNIISNKLIDEKIDNFYEKKLNYM
jgi:hypothetical protein